MSNRTLQGRAATTNRARVLHYWGTVCYWCGATATTTDHLIAKSRGGDDSIENQRPACRPCNSSRGNKPGPPPRLGRKVVDARAFFDSEPPAGSPRPFLFAQESREISTERTRP